MTKRHARFITPLGQMGNEALDNWIELQTECAALAAFVENEFLLDFETDEYLSRGRNSRQSL